MPSHLIWEGVTLASWRRWTNLTQSSPLVQWSLSWIQSVGTMRGSLEQAEPGTGPSDEPGHPYEYLLAAHTSSYLGNYVIERSRLSQQC